MLGYLFGYLYVDAEGGWRNMYGAAAPLAALLGIGMVRNWHGNRPRSDSLNESELLVATLSSITV